MEYRKDGVKEIRDTIKEKFELSILYDFYGELLDEHKRQIFEDYVLNDLSLGEIAAEAGISRQGVYDIVKRCTKKLREFEEKLHLVDKFHHVKVKVNDMKNISEMILRTGDLSHLSGLLRLSDEILNEI